MSIPQRNVAFLLMLLTLCACFDAEAQRKRRKTRARSVASDGFSDSQWWLGFKVGANVTQANLMEEYQMFVPNTTGIPDNYKKDYESFERPGIQAGFILSYDFKSIFSVSLQPTYINMNLGYANEYAWVGDGNNLAVEYEHRVTLNYLEFPLLLRADFTYSRVRPFVQLGAFYGTLLKADKFREVTSFDNASNAANPISNDAPVIGAKSLFINSNWGVMGGGGITYDFGNVRLGLEAMYKHGFNNVVDRRNRYSDNRMIGIGDALDDFSLQNIEVSFTCVFPMKFLRTGYYRSIRP
ncbi:MAG: outer membrane beta-barrel protein [Thermonemataceae bacterium]